MLLKLLRPIAREAVGADGAVRFGRGLSLTTFSAIALMLPWRVELWVTRVGNPSHIGRPPVGAQLSV